MSFSMKSAEAGVKRGNSWGQGECNSSRGVRWRREDLGWLAGRCCGRLLSRL